MTTPELAPDEVHDILCRALDLQDKLYSIFGTEVVLAGGAVRDLIHGRRPKDYDFCVLRKDEMQDDDIVEAAQEYAASLRGTLGVSEVKVTETYRDASRINYVIQFQFEGLGQVDVINYGAHHGSGREQVLGFDCTLNMVWLTQDEDGNPCIVVEPEAAQVLARVRPNELTKDGDGRKRGRLEYLAGKYPQYEHVDPHHTELLIE